MNQARAITRVRYHITDKLPPFVELTFAPVRYPGEKRNRKGYKDGTRLLYARLRDNSRYVPAGPHKRLGRNPAKVSLNWPFFKRHRANI